MTALQLPRRVDPKAMLKALEKEACERSLHEFVKRAWPHIEGGQEFEDNWHAEAICFHLEALALGEDIDGDTYNRLLINIPPGFAKPVHVDEPVATLRGVVRLGDVKIGDAVLTHRGRFRKVTAVHEQGVIPMLEISTSNGRKIRAAPDHPFLTPRGWVAAADLTLRDYLGVPRVREIFGNGMMSPEEARLLGYLVGDGCISQRSLRFVNADQDVLDDFIACAKTCGFHAYVNQHPNKKVRAASVVLKSSEERVNHWRQDEELPVLAWLYRHGLYRSNSYTKRIPQAVFASGPEAIANFIGAYWSCDGTIGIRHTGTKTTMIASATTVSEGLAFDVQRALSLINIDTRVRAKKVKLESRKQPGGVYHSFDVLTSQRHEVAKFANLSGLCKRKRESALSGFLEWFEPSLYSDAVTAVVQVSDGECRCLTVEEDCSFTANGVAVHNSMIVSVMFPAWLWGPYNWPQARIICASHSIGLAERDTRRMKQLIGSDWYVEHWGDHVEMSVDQNSKTNFENTFTGWRRAISAGGITGYRADFVLIDDPHSVVGAESDAERETTLVWFREAIPTRLNDPRKSAIVVIMQRLHENDVSGYILENLREYDHLMLPMLYDPDRAKPTKLGYEDARSERDELLFPARFPRGVVESYRNMGPYAFEGQMQQSPIPRGGGVIKDADWILWDKPEYPPLDLVIASLDTAYTEKTTNDASALTIWGVFSGGHDKQATRLIDRYGQPFPAPRSSGAEGTSKAVLMYAFNERYEFHTLVKRVAEECKRFKVDRLLVEGKASGISVGQELRRLYNTEGFAVQMINPGAQDKLARLHSIQHLFNEGMIYAPDKTWAEQVIRQVSSFPKGKHDDLVDSTSQALRHLRDAGLMTRSEEKLAEINDAMQYARIRHPEPLYKV